MFLGSDFRLVIGNMLPDDHDVVVTSASLAPSVTKERSASSIVYATPNTKEATMAAKLTRPELDHEKTG